ncbi:MAG: MFS transporter [Gammaproteobacteria bacterium]|nr:MFS transporter [Gammaproteobacteria bacterium]
MTERHHVTNPADRIPFEKKIAYGCGAFANNMLAAASGSMMVVLNLAFGMNPALVGWLSGIPRLMDAWTDPIMGYISDNTRSRWGRRRPYMFGGVFAAGLIFIVLWQLPEGRSEGYYFWYFLLVSLFFYLAYTVFATPWVALGYELTPDYHERTRLMGVQNIIGQLAYVISPAFLKFMELDQFGGLGNGASILAIVVAVGCIAFGIVPALALRERFGKGSSSENSVSISTQIFGFLRGFGTTIANRDFLMLAGATFLVFNGFQLIAAFQFYVTVFYLYAGDTDAAANLILIFGVISSIATFLVIALTTYLGSRIGKRKTFAICITISAIGYGLKWICYNPEYPYLLLICAPLIAFGLGSLFTLMASMIADVCDVDELNTGQRREGMYGSIFWFMVKLGMAAALLGSGYLLNATGFDVALEGNQSEQTLFLMRVYDVVVPVVLSLLAILLIARYSITESKAYEVRAQLEERRGLV